MVGNSHPDDALRPGERRADVATAVARRPGSSSPSETGGDTPVPAVEPALDPAPDATPVDRAGARGTTDPAARPSRERITRSPEALDQSGDPGSDAARGPRTRRDGLAPDDPAGATLRAGTQLAGRYRIVELVGEGGMGVVYRARDLTLELDVALKVLHPAIAHDPAKIAFFRNEVRVARMVTHPNVCRLHDLVEDPGGHFITMEYVPGESLAARVGRERLGLADALRILGDVARGLAAAHAAGVIHRDLKPSNVLIAGDRAIVADFGIAGEGRALSEGPQEVAGTRGYMAPEQMAGAPIDARVDVYAFGVLAFVLTTGRRPPLAATFTLPSGSAAAVLPAAEVAPYLEDLPSGLAALIADCLAPPAGRPRDAGELLRRLEAIVPRPARRWQLPVLLSAIAAAGIAVAAAQRGDRPEVGRGAPRFVLPAVDASSLPERDRWLGAAMRRLLADELIEAWGLEAELRDDTSAPAPGALVVAGAVSREPSGRLRLVIDGTSLEAATARELAISAARRLVTGRVPPAARHPTAAELAAVGAHDPEAWRLWRRAEHETLLMNFSRASDLCQQALARDPIFPVASLELALTHNNNDGAELEELAHAAELMDRVPVAPLWHLALTGARQLKDGKLLAAAATAQQLLGLDLTPREQLWIQLRWITARLYLGAPESSVTPELVALTESHPDHPAAYKVLAGIYLRSEQPTAPTLALRYASRAAELAPEDPNVHADLAAALLRAGRRDEARARAAELDQFDPDEKRFALGTWFALHMALDDLAEAELDARRDLAGTRGQHASGTASLAQIDLHWGQFDAGLRGLLASADELDAIGGTVAAASRRYLAGRQAWLLGEPATARAAFERVAAGRSRYAAMARVRARIAADKLDDARAAAAAFPDDSIDRAAAELVIADAAGDAAGVLTAFARIEQLSTTAEHLSAAAEALERSGRADQAAAMYERLVQHADAWREPIATTRAWSRLGHLREQAGDLAGARAAFTEVLRRWGRAATRIPQVDDARRRLRALDSRPSGGGAAQR